MSVCGWWGDADRERQERKETEDRQKPQEAFRQRTGQKDRETRRQKIESQRRLRRFLVSDHGVRACLQLYPTRQSDCYAVLTLALRYATTPRAMLSAHVVGSGTSSRSTNRVAVTPAMYVHALDPCCGTFQGNKKKTETESGYTVASPARWCHCQVVLTLSNCENGCCVVDQWCTPGTRSRSLVRIALGYLVLQGRGLLKGGKIPDKSLGH